MQDVLSQAAQRGYRTDEAARTISGVIEGIAFLIRLPENSLEMSVNIPEKRLAKLQEQVAASLPEFAAGEVAYHNFGVRLTMPGMVDLPAERLWEFLQVAARKAAGLVGELYTDTYEKNGEPFSAYLRGFFGALLGAAVGILPWMLVASLLHIHSWYLGFFISIASFYGYCWFRGAHHTTYAVTLIVVWSLLVMVVPGTVETVAALMSNPELSMTLGQALAYCFQPEVLVAQLGSMGFGLLANIAGLLVIRSRVLAYTHEPRFLRRQKKRPGDDDRG